MKGVLLTCPECGERNGMRIDTADLSACECVGCGETIDPADAIQHLREEAARWERFAEWLRAAGKI